MELFVTSVVFVVVAGVYLVLRGRQRGGVKPVPGPTAWPILGNVHQIDKTKLHVTLYEWMKAYGDIFQFTMLGQKQVVLNSSELFESVLNKFICRPPNAQNDINHDGTGPTLGNNTFIRQEMKQAVIDVVKDEAIQELFKEEIKALVKLLKDSEGSDVFVNNTIKKSVTSHVLISLLGCKPGDSDIEAVWHYLDAVGRWFAGGAYVVLSVYPWVKFLPGSSFKRVYEWNKSTMAEMIKELTISDGDREKNGLGVIAKLMKRRDELEAKDDEDEQITDKNIHATIVDYIAGSVVPWFSTMVGGILCIAKHDSVQEKVHAELDNVCQKYAPTLADRENLPYLSATVLEMFRYVSILTTTLPHLVTEDTEINRFSVEKDTVIFGGLFNLHHSEAIWNDGWTFRPERFIDASGKLLTSEHPLRKSLFPFGTGPRMCKGYPLAEPLFFTYVANILYYFNILPPANGELPDCDPRTFTYAPGLKLPQVNCRFEPRGLK